MPAWGQTMLLSVPAGPAILDIAVKRRTPFGVRRCGRVSVDLASLPLWGMPADERHEIVLELNAHSRITLQLALICKE